MLKVASAQSNIDKDAVKQICKWEIRWNYSQHYFAEQRGEEVIEDILRLASGRRARALLDAQLADEKRHAETYFGIANRLGFMSESKRFSEKYSQLVLSMPSLPEKIFVFQVLTESVAHAFISWRLSAIEDFDLNNADRVVLSDEVRHLDMASALLKICAPEEINEYLSESRRNHLIRQILGVTKNCFRDSIYYCFDQLNIELDHKKVPTTILDSLAARTVLKEANRQASLLGLKV